MGMDSSSKNLGVACLHICFSATTNIARALRSALSAIKYANVKYGEEHYRDYLKEKGHKFRSEKELSRMAAIVKNSDVERYAIVQEDIDIIQKYAVKWGMDYALTKKPEDLDYLIKKRFVDKQELNSQQQKIVDAFIVKDENGKPVMNEGIPQIIEESYMLTICTKDLVRWEHICREMEAKTHVPDFHDRLRDAQVAAKVNLIFARNRMYDRMLNRWKEQTK